MIIGMETALPATAATVNGASTNASGSQFTSAISLFNSPHCTGQGERDYELRMMVAARQAMRQITREHDAQLHVGTHGHVIDVLCQAAALQFQQKTLDLFEIPLAQRA